MEFETRPRDIQDLFRRKAIKLRHDPRVSRLLVVLTDSEHNRGLATEYVELSRMQFPVLPAGVKADFAAEKLPKENGFLLM